MTSVRIDKWLWAARFFKTRTLAARACELGRIQSNGQPAKAARCLFTFAMKKPGVRFTDHEVGAGPARCTPSEEHDRLRMPLVTGTQEGDEDSRVEKDRLDHGRSRP